MTITIPVYRVEHIKHRNGPYRATNGHYSKVTEELRWDHTDADHPSVWRDYMANGEQLRIQRDEVCGFSSAEQILTWFAGYITGLNRANFVLAIYNVPIQDVRQGMAQVVFTRADLEPVDRIRLTELEQSASL